MSYNNTKELESAIQSLKLKQAKEFELLKQQILITSDSFKPLNIIKNTLLEIIDNQTIKSNIIDTALVLGTNFLIEKIAPKKPANKLTKILVSFLEFAILKASAKVQ